MGLLGMAPGARLWSVKVLEFNFTSGECEKAPVSSVASLISGVDYVTKHAKEIDVANLSVGFKGNSTALDEAIRRSVKAGVIYVAAAGNAHENVSQFSPANNTDVLTVGSIVDTDGKCGGEGGVSAVGAGNTQVIVNDDVFAPFSNYGKKLDIVAPGYKIYTTDKNGTWTTTSGTSASAPLVSGEIALYKSLHPKASPEQVRNALMSLASTPKTICDQLHPNGRGYFKGYINNAPLPLLDAKGIENTTIAQPTNS